MKKLTLFTISLLKIISASTLKNEQTFFSKAVSNYTDCLVCIGDNGSNHTINHQLPNSFSQPSKIENKYISLLINYKERLKRNISIENVSWVDLVFLTNEKFILNYHRELFHFYKKSEFNLKTLFFYTAYYANKSEILDSTAYLKILQSIILLPDVELKYLESAIKTIHQKNNDLALNELFNTLNCEHKSNDELFKNINVSCLKIDQLIVEDIIDDLKLIKINSK